MINLPVGLDANARQRHDLHTNIQLSTSFLERAPDNAGSAFGVNPVTGRVARHYAWPSSGPSAAMIGALVQVAGIVSDTNGAPRPPSGNRRSGVPNLRPDRSDRVISRPLAGVSRRPSQISIPEPAVWGTPPAPAASR